MKQALFLIILAIIISCSKENKIKTYDLSGLYLDSLTYCYSSMTGGFAVKDTVVQKRVYKFTDSTYKIGPLYKLDSSFGISVNGSYRLAWPITFVHRPDNTILVIHDNLSTASFWLGNYDPSQESISKIHRTDVIIPQHYEIHRLKRIDK